MAGDRSGDPSGGPPGNAADHPSREPVGADAWSGALEWLAGASLMAMLALTTADVFGRYVVSRPVPGVIELVQYAMVLLICAALPVVTLRRQHISVGLLDGRLRGRSWRWQQRLIATICAAVLAMLAWALLDLAGSMRQQADVIGFLRLPTYPAAYGLAALTAATACVCARQAWRPPIGPDAAAAH